MYISAEIFLWGNVLENIQNAMNKGYIRSEKDTQWDLYPNEDE